MSAAMSRQNSEAEPEPAPNVVVREAAVSDIAGMIVLEQATESAAHWPESAYREIFAADGPVRIAFVVEERDQAGRHLRGFIVGRLADVECELENIVVDRRFRGHGYGLQLVQSLTAAARARNATRIFLEVRESNPAARGLYAKCGFVVTGRRPSYYRDPVEDAALYALRL
jgi:[ribosomal protein S18]-alanine N-acetyltransferase